MVRCLLGHVACKNSRVDRYGRYVRAQLGKESTEILPTQYPMQQSNRGEYDHSKGARSSACRLSK